MSLPNDLIGALFGGEKVYHGLDLGTYSSLWAYKRESGTVKTVDYSGNNRRGIPSLFWYSSDGREYAADEVLTYNGQVEDPLGVCSSVKMKLKESEIKLHNKSFKPNVILEKIIERIISISRSDLQKEIVDISFSGLVVGIPASFTAGEKNTVLSALEKVTGSRTIRLVPEPILAAISSVSFGADGNRIKLIYDLGAGTFDVCVLAPNKNITSSNPYPFIVKKADGLRIAGDIFDERMTELLISKFEKNPYTLNLANLKNRNHADYRLLRLQAREIKENLSTKDSTRESVMDSGLGMGAVTVTKYEFENVIRADIRKTVDLTYNTLKACNLGSSPDIDIVLVGGSSNIPLVKEMLKERFNWISDSNIFQRFPEKAIALGAALYAETPNVVDNTPVPFAYAVKTFSEELNRDVLSVIVPQDAELPFLYRGSFSPIYDNQQRIRFVIYEVYSSDKKDTYELDEGIETGYQFVHQFGKKVPKTTTIDLKATLTRDGILESETDDHGISANGVQKTRIGLEHKIK